MSKLATFDHLLIQEIKDLYSVEQQVRKILPKFAKAANNPLLRRCFELHCEESLQHLDRVEEAVSHLGASPRGLCCTAIRSLLYDAKAAFRDNSQPSIKDARLILAAQQIGHFEMCGYIAARTLAYVLGHDEVATVLYQTLKQEELIDQRLTEIAIMLYTESDIEDEDPSLYTLGVKI